MRIRRRFTIILVGTFLLSMSSCALIYQKINPFANPTDVRITTSVQDVEVFNSKHKLIGTTPLRVDGTNPENQTLTLEKEGYEPVTEKIVCKEMAGFAFLDALLLGVPYVVDVSTKAIYKVPQKKMNIVLKKKFDPKAEHVYTIVQDVQWKIADGTVIGKEDKKTDLYFKKSFFNSYIYKKNICSELIQAPYRTAECEIYEASDNILSIKPGSIFLQPEITNLKLDVNYKKGKRYCKVNIKWKFSVNSGDFVFKEVDDTISLVSEKTENKWVVADALVLSINKVSNNESLFKEIMELRKNINMNEFNSAIVINKIYPPRFTKNKDLIKHLMDGVITIESEKGAHGSGFFISEDGYIITNYHVVRKLKNVKVRLGKTLTLIGEVIRVNEGYDLALIKVSGNGFVALPVGDSDSLSVGEDVFAIGTPEDISLGQSVTKGIISGRRKFDERIFIQTDVSVNHGNSGGPLINELGEVIGVVSQKLIGVGTEGIGFCIPSNTISEVLNITFKQ